MSLQLGCEAILLKVVQNTLAPFDRRIQAREAVATFQNFKELYFPNAVPSGRSPQKLNAGSDETNVEILNAVGARVAQIEQKYFATQNPSSAYLGVESADLEVWSTQPVLGKLLAIDLPDIKSSRISDAQRLYIDTLLLGGDLCANGYHLQKRSQRPKRRGQDWIYFSRTLTMRKSHAAALFSPDRSFLNPGYQIELYTTLAIQTHTTASLLSDVFSQEGWTAKYWRFKHIYQTVDVQFDFVAYRDAMDKPHFAVFVDPGLAPLPRNQRRKSSTDDVEQEASSQDFSPAF